MIWQLQDAKRKFSQLVREAVQEGPQIVTKHGQEVVVILSMAEYRKLSGEKATLLDLLMDPRFAGSNLETARDQEDFGRDLIL